MNCSLLRKTQVVWFCASDCVAFSVNRYDVVRPPVHFQQRYGLLGVATASGLAAALRYDHLRVRRAFFLRAWYRLQKLERTATRGNGIFTRVRATFVLRIVGAAVRACSSHRPLEERAHGPRHGREPPQPVRGDRAWKGVWIVCCSVRSAGNRGLRAAACFKRTDAVTPHAR